MRIGSSETQSRVTSTASKPADDRLTQLADGEMPFGLADDSTGRDGLIGQPSLTQRSVPLLTRAPPPTNP
jgi:hypothetical protein